VNPNILHFLEIGSAGGLQQIIEQTILHTPKLLSSNGGKKLTNSFFFKQNKNTFFTLLFQARGNYAVE
jgi:hypothetical protein